MPEPQQKPRHGLRHIPELDGIRGIAALVVFGHHALTTTVRETLAGGWPASIRTISHIFEFANTGVDLFFVLSGFLITSILIGEKSSSRFYQDFYWKRALRILPVYLVTIAMVWIFLHQTAYMLLALAFVINFAGLSHRNFGEPGPFWSLAIEEQFYLLWPTLVRRLSLQNILRASITIGLGCTLLRLIAAHHHHYSYSYTPFRADGLAFGAALACHFHKAGDDPRRRRSLDPLLITLVILGIAAIACSRTHLPGAYAPAIYQTGIVLTTGAFIGLTIAHSGSAVLGVFRSRILVFFGLISYAFYLVHIYVILAYRHFHGTLPPGDVLGYWIEFIICFAGSIAAALISRYALELPALRLRKYVLKHPHLNAEHADPPLPLAPM